MGKAEKPKGKAPKPPVETPRSRDAVLSDFRKIAAGPLRVLRPGKKPKA